MDDFLFYSYMIMVIIICSWDQSCVRESITEAPCGNLGHDLVKKTTIYGLGHKNIWISFENRDKKFPLCVQIPSVEKICSKHAVILTCSNICLRPVAEKGYVWHQVEVRFPNGLVPFLPLIQREDKQSKFFFPANFLITISAGKDFSIFSYDFADLRVFVCLVKRNQQSERYSDECLSVFDIGCCSHSNETAFEVCWVFLVGLLNAIFITPVREYLCPPLMFLAS